MSESLLAGMRCAIYFKSGAPPVARPRLTPEDRALVLETRACWVRRAEEPTKSRASSWLLPCVLCAKYYNRGACAGCPVFSASGQIRCRETPYIQASALFRASDNHFSPVAFARAADRVIAWIDEHLLTPGVSAATEPKCPKCGSTDISLHLCFKDNTAGCRSCRHVWDMESPLAVAPLRESGDPLGLRDVRLGGDAPSLHGEAVLARRRTLADDQQLLNGTEE